MTAPLTIGMLGSMRVLVGSAPLPALRSRKALWLLGLLVLRSNRPVAREWVASILWPDSDLSTALSNLRPVMSELRKALGDQGYRLESPDRVTIVLDLAGAEVDVVAFDEAISRGALRQAVELYGGPLMEGCLEEWLPQERDFREANFCRALQSLADEAYEAGDHAFALENYRRLVAADPWRDAPRRGMMKTLARMGDINAALQCYRDYAHTLRSDGGMIPDEKTTALYSRLRTMTMRGDRRAAPEAEEPPKAKLQGRLPHPLTPLLGREDDCLEIAAAIRQRRLVTLLGPGGIGKTRLASEVAREMATEFTDGAWLVSLEHLKEGHLIVSHLLRSLEIAESSGVSSTRRLIDETRSKRLLLILDNCEHLLEEVASLIAQVLGETAYIKILATSREALGVLGEKAYLVPPLPTPEPEHLPSDPSILRRVLLGYESVQLFMDRARSIRPGFELTNENAKSVAQISIRMQGVPLALELAAARLRSMTPVQVAERLGDHLSLLTTGARGASERQRTLRATLDWSHKLLTDSEKRLFRSLSAFSGGWTLEAAEEVCGEGNAPNEISDLHDSLVSKSLIDFDERHARFRFLETVRQYAVERLNEAKEAEMLESKHREWCLRLAEEAEAELAGSSVETCLDRLDAESANLRAAMIETSPATDTLKLAGSLWRWWYLRGRYFEGRNLIERALDRRSLSSPLVQQKALYGGGCLAYSQGDYDVAETWLQESLRLAEDQGLVHGVAKTLNVLGNVASSQNFYSEGRSYYERSLALQRQLGDEGGVLLALYNLGTLSMALCELADARERFQEALNLYRRKDDSWGCGLCLSGLGLAAMYQGELDCAQAWLEEAIEKFSPIQVRERIGQCIYTLGCVALERGHLDLAQELAEQAVDLLRAAAAYNEEGYALGLLGNVAFARQASDHAWQIQSEALRIATHHRLKHLEFRILAYQAATTFQQGDLRGAKRLWEASLRGHVDYEYRIGIALSLDGLAVVASAEGDYERAAQNFGAAAAIREETGFITFRHLRPMNEAAEKACRSGIGDHVYAAHRERGRGMRWRDAAEDALRGTSRRQARFVTASRSLIR